MRISSLGARPVSDADILLHLWERHGIEGFRRIEGEFAAAIFDCNARRLILAVDALGLRSLHYARRKGGLGFATSAVPVARWRGVVAPDLTRLASLLITTGTVGERSILEGVQRVRPGHAIICERPAEAREERWWTPDLSPIGLGFDEAVNAVRGELDHAVKT
jgi:asparagine synthase (glutamine-hydrolysing)